MRWIDWALNALASGEGSSAAPFGSEATARERCRPSLEALRAFDHSLASERPRPQPELRDHLTELARATTEPAGRLTLGLSQSPADGRPAPDGPPPAYFEGWFPALTGGLERFEFYELAVHVLAAEVRARLAHSAPGGSRPQDLHVAVLLLREALRGDRARLAYLDVARLEFPGEVASMAVAASLIKSAFVASPARRVYRAQETALALAAASELPSVARQAETLRVAEALRLDFLADDRARAYFDSQRASVQARRDLVALRSAADAPDRHQRHLALQIFDAALEVARHAAAAGTSDRSGSLVARRARLATGNAGAPPAVLAEATYASTTSSRMVSELKMLAIEASAAAEAARNHPTAGHDDKQPVRATPGLQRLRLALGLLRPAAQLAGASNV